MTNKKFLIEVQDTDEKILFKVENDGTVFYMENGKLVKVTNQKELAIAFATTILGLLKEKGDK